MDQGLRIWDKSLVCCSTSSLSEGWIQRELEKSHAKEDAMLHEHGQQMRFMIPFALDRTVYNASNPLNDELRFRMGADFSSAGYGSAGYDQEINKLVRVVRGY